MFRAIAKWMISRSIDEGIPLSGWLRWWIRRDPSLRQFELQSRQLCRRLTCDAAAWIARGQMHVAGEPVELRQPASVPLRSRGLRTIAWSVTACALAASALIVLARFHTGDDRIVQPPLSANHRPIGVDSSRAAVMNERQILADAWKVGRAAAGQWQASRVISTLDDGLERQRQELTSSTRSAVSFFAIRLPASAARLVGLHRDQS
jgi:hypothetical protein